MKINDKYSKKDLFYIFYSLVKEKCLPIKYKELEPIQTKLYLLFDPFSHWLTVKGDNKLDIWQLCYISSCINLLTKNEYKDFINEDLIIVLTYNMSFEDRFENPLLDRINLVFKPEEYSPDTITWFLRNFYDILYILLWDEEENRKFKYEKFNDLYKVMEILKRTEQLVYTIDVNIICLLLSYCYLNNIRTYEPVFYYVNKKEYCRDILKLNGINLEELCYRDYDPIELKSVYNLIPFMTEKKVKSIIL